MVQLAADDGRFLFTQLNGERLTMRFAMLLAVIAICAITAVPASAQPCVAGFFSATGNSPCMPCAIGSYAPDPGATSCIPCEPGRFADTEGSQACQPCAAGRFAANSGSIVCSACPAGTFSLVGSESCTPCAEGFVAPSPGSSECTACPPGFTSNASRTECIEQSVSTTPSTWGKIKLGKLKLWIL